MSATTTTTTTTTSTETKDISSTSEDKMALTKKLTSLFGEIYVSTKKRIPLSDSLVKQLEQIESIVENKSTKIADLVDKKLTEQLESLESKKKEVRDFVDKTVQEKLESLESKKKEVLETVVVPTATSILKKSDAVISYVLPPSASDDEDEDDANATSPLALAKDIVDKTSKRIRKRVASMTEKKEEMIKQVNAKREEIVKYGLSLVAYAKSMSGKAGDIDLREIAIEVSKPYRKQAENILVGVTDYGEYFMKSVREYEEAGAKTKSVGTVVPEGKLNSMLAEVAHKFVEPCLVRTVAIFFVCGDEIKKVKTMHLEPKVDAMKKTLTTVRSDVLSAVAKKSEGLSAVLLAKKAELAALRTKLREMISELTEEKLKDKFNQVIERVNFNETLVTLREKVDIVLKKYDLKKYEAKVSDLVEKMHKATVEWVSPKKTAHVE